MTKIVLTEQQLKHVLKKLVLENVYTEKDRIYTQCSVSKKEEFRDIFENGLRKHFNGEADGIWFSRGRPFYSNVDAPLVFSLPYTEEIRRLCKFDLYDWENNSSVLIAHKDIPIDLLTLESCILIKYELKNGNFGYFTVNKNEENSKLYKISYENLSNWDRNNCYIIYEDMYQKLFGHEIDTHEKELIMSLSNFKFDNFLD